MINKTFPTLISALLLSAMLIVFLSLPNQTVYQSKHQDPFRKLKISNSMLTLSKAKSTVEHVNKNADLSLSEDSKATKKITADKSFSNQYNSIQAHSSDIRNSSDFNGLRVAGLVTDQDKFPIEGVVVVESGRNSGTKTDSSGYYELALPSVDQDYRTIIFRRAGYEEKVNHLLGIDAESTSNFLLNTSLTYSPDTVSVHGWIGESNGTRVPGIIVKLSSLQRNLYYSAITDDQGNFLFEGIKQNVNYQIKHMPSAKYQTIELENILVTAETLPIHITLEPINLTILQGVVVDNLGGHVENLDLRIRSLSNPIYDADLTTDDFGRFELLEFPVGEVLFSTFSPRFLKVSGIDLAQQLSTEIIVPVDIGTRQLSGWVRDEKGWPVSGARVILDADFEINRIISSSLRITNTDDSGYFEFTDLGEGEHIVTIYAKDFINQGLSYNTSSRIDQLYFQLTPGNTSLINSETLKMKLEVEHEQ